MLGTHINYQHGRLLLMQKAESRAIQHRTWKQCSMIPSSNAVWYLRAMLTITPGAGLADCAESTRKRAKAWYAAK